MTDQPLEQEEPVVVDPVAAAEQERDEYLDSLQRLKAEFDNYRKRVARAHSATITRAGRTTLSPTR